MIGSNSGRPRSSNPHTAKNNIDTKYGNVPGGRPNHKVIEIFSTPSNQSEYWNPDLLGQ